jgi:two-component system response regulator BaeR
MSETILIVEDEEKLAGLLRDYLNQAGFLSEWIANGLEVVERVKRNKPDLILLDLMLPGRDGMDICKDIRMFSQLPIIMVTARVEEIDRLLGLGLGADDYICKPYSPREVVARVKAVLRRTSKQTALPSNRLSLDESRYQAILDGIDLELTAVEFKLLHFLESNQGRIYNRQQLMDRIYPDERIVSDRTIDSHIKKLRRKIEHVDPEIGLIHSVYGVGYKFEATT